MGMPALDWRTALQAARNDDIPLILAGPLLRRVSSEQVCLWMALSRPCDIHAQIVRPDTSQTLFDQELDQQGLQSYQVGLHAHICHLNIRPEGGVPEDCLLEYDLALTTRDGKQVVLSKQLPALLYQGCSKPHFRYVRKLTNVLHGSCRKPHHDGGDGLLQLDNMIAEEVNQGPQRPDMLHLTGDQVYVDDVAGPMLSAINQVIDRLGLFDEPLFGATISKASELADHPHGYYHRELLLPHDEANEGLIKQFIKAKRKPVFTSVNAQNHLISLAEMIAMYLLVWSPALWDGIELKDDVVDGEHKQRFNNEKLLVLHFAEGLSRVQRTLAHIPIYMIFDDHDVTDDWNLTRGWEQTVYGHPFSKRVVGNALISYWLCQGWGNHPEAYTEISKAARRTFTEQGLQEQDPFIDRLLQFEQWHFKLDTQPLTLVLDSRTRRWRSESNLNKPSGLMDWEALCEFQQDMLGEDAVIVVSPAPIFGVKMIEAIQKVFALCGKALVVDAENWMAHKGTASVILNVFTHVNTPPQFIILSGDVHYSFVYDVRLRRRKNSPHITQFTCSGIKNEFPASLLKWLDILNQYLYGRRSPLNWFTRRRSMRVRHRIPSADSNRTMINRCALGQLQLHGKHQPVTCTLLCADGETITFAPAKKNS